MAFSNKKQAQETSNKEMFSPAMDLEPMTPESNKNIKLDKFKFVKSVSVESAKTDSTPTVPQLAESKPVPLETGKQDSSGTLCDRREEYPAEATRTVEPSTVEVGTSSGTCTTGVNSGSTLSESDPGENPSGSQDFQVVKSKKHKKKHKVSTSATAVGSGNPSESRAPGPAAGKKSTETSKRAREVSDTPPQPKKVARLDTTGLPRHLQVAIVKVLNPNEEISETEAEYIRSQLVAKIRETPKDKPVGRFNQSGLCKGVFKVSCSDTESLEWLREAVSDITVGGDNLIVCSQDSIKLQTATMWIPGPPVAFTVVTDTLERQNQGLNTSSWRRYNTIFRKEGKTNGQSFLFGIDTKSIADVRAAGGHLFYELSRVQVKLRNK